MKATKPFTILVIASAMALGLSLIDLFWAALFPSQTNQNLTMLWELRLPRVLGAWAAGACLGLAGALAQSLFRNTLADPYLIGSSAGAQLAVVLSLIAFGSIRVELALVGALLAVLAALSIARQVERVLIAGVVLSIVLGSIVSLLTTLAPQTLRASQSYMLGQTQHLDWQAGVIMLAVGGFALLFSRLLAPHLPWLALGAETASSQGIHAGRLSLQLNLLIAALTGVSVAYCGMIAFIGLGAPHLTRALFGASLLNRPKHFLTLSSLSGALLLLVSDTLARNLLRPTELPIGVITAILGGAYLLYLLAKSNSLLDKHKQA